MKVQSGDMLADTDNTAIYVEFKSHEEMERVAINLLKLLGRDPSSRSFLYYPFDAEWPAEEVSRLKPDTVMRINPEFVTVIEEA